PVGAAIASTVPGAPGAPWVGTRAPAASSSGQPGSASTPQATRRGTIQFTVPTLNSRTSPAPRSPARRVGAQRVLVSLDHPIRVAMLHRPATGGEGLGLVPAGILQLEDTAH